MFEACSGNCGLVGPLTLRQREESSWWNAGPVVIWSAGEQLVFACLFVRCSSAWKANMEFCVILPCIDIWFDLPRVFEFA